MISDSEEENNQIIQGDLVYSIQENENQANVVKYISNINETIIIPRSINYESKEYIVTSIKECAFDSSKVKSIQFASNSEIKIIEKGAIASNSIENFEIPSSLIKLEDGWCSGSGKKSKISPDNPRYTLYEDKLILEKSSPESQNYDVLVFCVQNVEQIAIPSFIEHIGGYSFYGCPKLREVEIPADSKLLTVGDFAFARSEIERFTISPHLRKIGKYCFLCCRKLKTVEVPPNSELQEIGTKAFNRTSIERFTIPSHVKEIGQSSLSTCSKLKYIEFQENSELREIGCGAFSHIKIECFTIPPHLTQISRYAFLCCGNLRKIEFPPDTEIRTIECEAFRFTSIESFTIPSSLVELNDGWCWGTQKLNRIEIIPDNPRYSLHGSEMVVGKSSVEDANYDVLVFCARNVEEVTIPSFVKTIGAYSFDECQNIRRIEIPKNVMSIERNAFSNTNIEYFRIPAHITKICEQTFSDCERLRGIDVPVDAELKVIEENAFQSSGIECFRVPAKVTEIGEEAFSDCRKLKIIEFDEKSQIQNICTENFNKKTLIMIPPNLKILNNLK